MSDESESAGAIMESAREFDDLMPVLRAHVIEKSAGVDVMKSPAPAGAPGTSNQVTTDDYTTSFTNLGAVDPVYDPEMLALLFEHSNSLRQNVDAYGTNIDGFGHRFDPIFDVDAPDLFQRVRQAMIFDAQALRGSDAEVEEPSDDEVKKKAEEITRVMRFEKGKLQHFFDFCSPDTSFVTLRRRTRQDLEATGNAYWEVLRNKRGEIAQFVYMVSYTVRLLPLDLNTTEVVRKIRISDLSFDEIPQRVRLRKYAQIVEGRSVFFKEFGDPRTISSLTGNVYPNEEALKKEEPQALPATEVLHFSIFSSRSAYGVPRWIGNLLAVIGSRQAEEVNFNYFENKSVPPLAILVSGGRMGVDSVKRVQEYVESHLKGKRNFHKILVIEAEPSTRQTNESGATRTRIDIKPLTQAQQQDALFQNYDERNIDKVGQAFRMPRMLRGDIRDFNKSTAEAALTFAEVQVFEPERQEFDFFINRKILSTLGIRFWRFVSLAPVIRDAIAMSEIVKNLCNAMVLTPEEGRELAGDVFNRDFKRLNVAWVKQPGAFTVAGINASDPSTPLPTRPARQLADDDVAPPSDAGEGATGVETTGVEANKRMALLHRFAKREAERLLFLRDAIAASETSAWKSYLARENAAE